MGIFDIFSSNAAAQPAQPSQQQQVPQQQYQPAATSGAGNPGNIPQQTVPNTFASGNTSPNGVVPVTENKPETPLDQFSDLFKNDPNAKQPGSEPIFNIDPAKIKEAAGKVDFAQVISPEVLTAISAGGEAATAAFAQAMNVVSQAVYAQSALASSKLIEQAMAKARENFVAELPSLIKGQSLNESLRNENPAYSHPAAQPVVDMIQQQLRQRYPTATVAELNSMAQKYMANLGQAFSQKHSDVASKSVNTDTDWEAFLRG